MKNLIINKNCHYLGFDLNKDLESGYNWIKENHFKYYPQSYVENFDSCSLVNELKNKIDFIFTSPPFFNDEKYSGVNIVYSSIEDWKKNLILPVFKNCNQYLKSSGKMWIDMKEKYCDTILLAAQEAGFMFESIEEYKLNKSHYMKNSKNQNILKFIKL